MPNSVKRFMYKESDSLTLPARREDFVTLRAWLFQIAEELSLPEKTRRQFLVAADEIFTNIANYGYPDGTGSVIITAEFDTKKKDLVIVFSDTGVPYNPLEAAVPDTSSLPSERKIGGLGIFMVKRLMDSVEYRRENGYNRLSMTKHLNMEDR